MQNIVFRFTLDPVDFEEIKEELDCKGLNQDSLLHDFFFGDVLIHDYQTGNTFFAGARILNFIHQIDQALKALKTGQIPEKIYDLEQLYDFIVFEDGEYIVLEDVFGKKKFNLGDFKLAFQVFYRNFFDRISVDYQELMENPEFLQLKNKIG